MPPPDTKTQIPSSAPHQKEQIRRYHKETYADAKLLLNQIFQANNFSERFKKITKINILIPGAGAFPGYLPFLEKLHEKFPSIKTVSLTLIDPTFTNIEVDALKEHLTDIKGIKTTTSFKIMDLAKFSEQYHSNLFDMVYFEHPEISGMATLLYQFSSTPTLSSAIPQLINIVKPDATIIAVCQTREEQLKMQRLLSYSLGLQTISASIAGNLIFPRSYCKGLLGSIPLLTEGKAEDQKMKNKVVQAKVKQIKHSEKLLAVFFMLSVAIYALRFGEPNLFLEQSASFILMCAQIAFHRPEPRGLGIKILLVVSQLALLMRGSNTNDVHDATANVPRSEPG